MPLKVLLMAACWVQLSKIESYYILPKYPCVHLHVYILVNTIVMYFTLCLVKEEMEDWGVIP